MAYLAHVEQKPTMDALSDEERRTLNKHFDANAYELNIDGKRVEYAAIDEVEVAKAAREGGPAGWFVKKVVFAGDRYHIGVYFGDKEAILTNFTLASAAYVVQTIAYYANNSIRYTGLEGVSPVTAG